MSLGAAEYDVLYEGDEQPTRLRVRTNHWLKMERTLTEPVGKLEQVLRVLHIASGSDLSFNEWADTVDDWDGVKATAEDDAVPPGGPPPSTSPS